MSSISVFSDFVNLMLTDEGQPYYGQFIDRLKELNYVAQSIGWGYGDYIDEQVFHLYSELDPNEQVENDEDAKE